MNRKQRVSMIVRMLLVPFTRPPFSGEDLLLERTRTYNEFLESTDIYYQPKLQAYKDRRDRFIRSLEGEMKPDRLSELEELLQMFYPEEEMAAYLRGNGSRRLEGYYFGVLLKIATEFVTLRDGRVSIKMWDTPEHSEEEVFPHSSGLYKVELWSEISRVITPDVLIAGYFVQCGIRDPRYLRGIPDNITLSDALLNRVNGKGIAETHLHLSAGMNYLSVWEAVTDPAALRITPVRETSTYQRHQRREQKGHRNLLVAGWLRLMMAKYFLDAEGKSGGPPEERGIFDLPAYYYRLEKDSGEKELEVRLLEAVLSDALTPEALSALQDLLREKSEQHLEILYTDYGVRPGQTALDVLMRGPYLPYAPLGASGEMLLLFFSLQHIRDFPEHIGFQRVFLCYLRIKNAYFSDKLQPTGLSGLTFFRRYFTSGVTAALVRRGDDSQKIRLAYRAAFLNQFHCGTLRKLEVKISPPRISGSPGANTVRRAAAKQLAELFTVYYTLLEESQAVSREERPTLGVVYHFLRKDVLRAPLRFCWASQPEQDPQDPVSRLRLEGAQVQAGVGGLPRQHKAHAVRRGGIGGRPPGHRRLVVLRCHRQLNNLIPALAQGDKLHLGPAAGQDFAAQHALVPRLVKAPALGTAGVGPGHRPRVPDAGAGVHMAQGQVVQPRGGDGGGGNRAVFASSPAVHVAVEDHQLQPAVLRRGKAVQRAALPPGGRKGRAVDHGVLLRQLHGLNLAGAEDMYVLRPQLGRVGGAGGVAVVVARREEDRRADAPQGAGEGLDRLLIGGVPVQQVAGQENRLGPPVGAQVGQALQQLPLLRAPLGRLPGVQAVKGGIQMKIRRVNNPHSLPPIPAR